MGLSSHTPIMGPTLQALGHTPIMGPTSLAPGHTPNMGPVGHMTVIVLNLWGTYTLCSTMVALTYFHANSIKGSIFSIPLPALQSFFFTIKFNLNWNEVRVHCGFLSVFPQCEVEVDHYFTYLLAIFISFLEKYLFVALSSLLNWMFVLLR